MATRGINLLKERSYFFLAFLRWSVRSLPPQKCGVASCAYLRIDNPRFNIWFFPFFKIFFSPVLQLLWKTYAYLACEAGLLISSFLLFSLVSFFKQFQVYFSRAKQTMCARVWHNWAFSLSLQGCVSISLGVYYDSLLKTWHDVIILQWRRYQAHIACIFAAVVYFNSHNSIIFTLYKIMAFSFFTLSCQISFLPHFLYILTWRI